LVGSIWGGNFRKQQLAFACVEIKLHPTHGMELGFIIERFEKYSHPFLFEEDIMLRCTSKGDNTNKKARIFPIKKTGSIKKRPLVSGKQCILQFEGNIKMLIGVIEVIQVLDHALHDWINL
jgi:hypothetical protein